MPHLVWSASTTSLRPASTSARSVSLSVRFGVVKPGPSAIPCTPRKTTSRCSDRRLCTATGPTSASDGVRTPPVSTTVRSGCVDPRSTSATWIELVTMVRPGMASSARASVHVVVPAEMPIAVPGRTSVAASSAMASFCARWRTDLASKPGSSVLLPTIEVAPP